MAQPVTLSEFRNFSRITDDIEGDASLQIYLDSAIKIAERITVKSVSDFSDSADVKFALMHLALFLYNEKDFPKESIKKAVFMLANILLAGEIDMDKQTITGAE